MFCKKDTSGSELVNNMYYLMNGMEKTTLEYTEEDFLKGFETFTVSLEQKDIYNIFKNKITDIIKAYMKLKDLKEF